MYMAVEGALLSLLLLSCLFSGGKVWCDCTDTDIHIAGGNYTLSRGLTVGSMLIYRCPEDYYPYPELSHVCEINNKWVPEPKSQKCKRKCYDDDMLPLHQCRRNASVSAVMITCCLSMSAPHYNSDPVVLC